MLKNPILPISRFDSVNAALHVASEQDESGVAFVDISDERDRRFTWADIYRRARCAAGVIRRLGVGCGDRVALILPTSIGFMDVFFGVLLAGGIPVPLPPPFRIGHLAEYHESTARMLEVVGARLLLTDGRIHKLLGRVNALARPPLGCHCLEMFDQESEGEIVEPVSAEQTAVIQFSSGSTVDPKAVVLSHRQVMAQCAALMMLMPAPANGPQIGVSWVPLYHDMGLIGSLLTAVCYGRSIGVFMRPEHFLTRPAAWLRTISRYGATISPAPNFGYALCLRRIRDEEMVGIDLSSWRYALNGADTISMDVMRRFADRFSRWGLRREALTPVYGLAEASLAVTFSAPDTPPHSVPLNASIMANPDGTESGSTEVVSVGRPIPGVEVQIRDESGVVMSEKHNGLIFVRGPSVMSGYFDNTEATSNTIHDGWLNTGDLGFVVDGELYVSGRAKDVVVIRGVNYIAQAIEACLEGIEGIRAGCIVAVGYTPSGADGEELLLLAERAFCAQPANDSSLVSEIRAAVLERLGVRAHGVYLLKPHSLPRTSSGKLRRSEALRRFISGTLVPLIKVKATEVEVFSAAPPTLGSS
jgi:fatty-acyl-CoA synthase